MNPIDNRPYINTNTLKDNRIESNRLDPHLQSIIDKIDDPFLGKTFVEQAIKKLGYAQVASLAQWAVQVVSKQGGNAGKLFVSIANKELNKA